MDVSTNRGGFTPQNGWFRFISSKNPIKIHDLGGKNPYFWVDTQMVSTNSGFDSAVGFLTERLSFFHTVEKTLWLLILKMFLRNRSSRSLATIQRLGLVCRMDVPDCVTTTLSYCSNCSNTYLHSKHIREGGKNSIWRFFFDVAPW